MKRKALKRRDRSGVVKFTEINKGTNERKRGYVWVVRYGNRQRKFFRHNEAKKRDQFVDKQNEARLLLAEKDRGIVSDAETMEAAARGKELLKPFKKKIGDAVEFYLAHLEALEGLNSTTVSEVRRDFLDCLEQNGTSADHYNTLKLRTARFEKSFGDVAISSITTDMVLKWINGLDGLENLTKNHFRSALLNMFNFAADVMAVIETNPVEKVKKWKVAKKENILLTNDETMGILENAPVELLPAFVLMAFCGVRVAEVRRLKWSDIIWSKKSVRIAATSAKNSRGRHVDIPDNAIEWLTQFKDESGLISKFQTKTTFDKVARKVREAAGVTKYRNGFRKTFISCHYEKYEDINNTAKQAGNSVKVIETHYKQLVTNEDAVAYFNIRPDAKSGVIPFTKVG